MAPKRYLNEAVTGTIEFKLVRLKVHTMELSIIRKELTGVGASAFSETDTLAKFELMDGLPVKAEVVRGASLSRCKNVTLCACPAALVHGRHRLDPYLQER
jgi:hypothetical protein